MGYIYFKTLFLLSHVFSVVLICLTCNPMWVFLHSLYTIIILPHIDLWCTCRNVPLPPCLKKVHIHFITPLFFIYPFSCVSTVDIFIILNIFYLTFVILRIFLLNNLPSSMWYFYFTLLIITCLWFCCHHIYEPPLSSFPYFLFVLSLFCLCLHFTNTF